MQQQSNLSSLPLEAEQVLRGLKALTINPFYQCLVEEAREVAQRQLAEIMQDEGTNIPAHFKAIGFVNGLEHFKNILQEKLEYYKKKAEEDHVTQEPNLIKSGE